MEWAKQISDFSPDHGRLLLIVLAIGGLELALRVALTAAETEQSSLALEIRNKLDTAEENRADLPMYLPRQGGSARRDDSKGNWTPRFEFNSKSLDKDCARKLFSSGKIKLVMFGGSTMAMSEQPTISRLWITTLSANMMKSLASSRRTGCSTVEHAGSVH